MNNGVEEMAYKRGDRNLSWLKVKALKLPRFPPQNYELNSTEQRECLLNE